MPTFPLYSSCLVTVDYDPGDETMMLQFHRGGQGTYIYEDVPESVYTDFLNASSKGSFFNKYIRDEYTFR